MQYLQVWFLLSCCLLLNARPFFMDDQWYDPSPSLGATITFDRVRFTLITKSLIRLECGKHNTTFDDRASFIFLHRNLPVPRYNVSHPNETSIQISTDALRITYRTDGGQVSSCANAQAGRDQAGGTPVEKYKSGYSASNMGDCCSTCDHTLECTSWVFDTSVPLGKINCQILKHANDTVPSPNRIFGRVTTFCRGGLQIIYHNAGKEHIWTPETSSIGNLNGTVDGADCDSDDSTPIYCYNVNYPSRMQKGLLSRDGWSLVDDATPRFTTTESR
jgi:hypothetical protein